MKLVIASDFAGFTLKEAVKKHLIEVGHEVSDVGQQSSDKNMDYIDAATNLTSAILDGSFERGFIFCGTGAGVSIAVNKFKGIYCAACESLFTAPKTAVINNANVLAMGARVIAPENACEMADAWLTQGFCKNFAPERAEFVGGLFKKLQALENKNLK